MLAEDGQLQEMLAEQHDEWELHVAATASGRGRGHCESSRDERAEAVGLPAVSPLRSIQEQLLDLVCGWEGVECRYWTWCVGVRGGVQNVGGACMH